MGVIQRQSLKHTTVNLAGLVIGGLSTLFIYPHTLESYGLFQVIMAVGVVGLPILSLGANTVALRFFPKFYDKETGHHGFLPFLLLMCLAGGLLFVLSGLLFWPWILKHFAGHSEVLSRHLWAAWPVAILYVTNSVLSTYSANFKRIVVPSILLDLSQKIAVPLLLVSVWQQWLTLSQAVWGLLAHGLLVFAGLSLYLKSQGHWRMQTDWRFLTPELKREIIRFVLFASFGGFALMLAAKADLFMVGSLRPMSDAGIYAIAGYLASMMEIPIKSLYAASVSSVTRYLADDNRRELRDLYQKVSIHLLMAGLLIFGGLWISIDAIFLILPNTQELSTGKYVFFFIGFSRLIEMGTGLNNYLIYYSKYYAWSLFSLGMMAFSNIMLSLWLIPAIGIQGAAVATLISIALYNAFTLGLVWVKFGLQPFTASTWKAISISAVVFLVVGSIPYRLTYPVFDAALHSGLYGAFVVFLWVRLGLSSDLEQALKNLTARFRR